MTIDEAIKTLREDYCGNRIICELHPDKCNREDCEIWLAIKALAEQPVRVLETQPDGDAVSKAAAIDEKKILDMTCGGRSIWFNKSHPSAIYCDKRKEMHEHLWKNAGNCKLIIDPDVICDFTNLPFEDSSFSLVVFDPPHLTTAKETSWLVKKYGKLDENWPEMLREGFLEGMRVLKKDGVLIFKWSEYNIPSAEVWKAIGQKPLFGHHSGKKSNTFWACFMKGQK